jgi:hypothetical protein
MNRFGAVTLALAMVAAPLSTSAATPKPHPTASPNGHRATGRGGLLVRHPGGPGGQPTLPPMSTQHSLSKSATMQDRVPHNTPSPK